MTEHVSAHGYRVLFFLIVVLSCSIPQWSKILEWKGRSLTPLFSITLLVGVHVAWGENCLIYMQKEKKTRGEGKEWSQVEQGKRNLVRVRLEEGRKTNWELEGETEVC